MTNNDLDKIFNSNCMLSAKVAVAETEDEFIFTTITPFLDSLYERRVSKKELVEAVSYIRMRDIASKIYGVALPAGDYNSARAISDACERAYNSGFEAGVEKEREKLRLYLERGVKE